MNLKIKNIYTKLEEKNLNGLILSSPANISYLAELKSRDSYLLVSRGKNIYITDSRYSEEVRKNLKGCEIIKTNGSVFKTIAEACQDLGFQRVGFEERHMPFAEYQKIKEEAKGAIDLIPTQAIVEDLREIKTLTELKKIKKAAEITISAFNFIKDFISPGKKEIEIAAELERFIRYQGAYASAFDIIIASGPNSSFCHHLTSRRKIRNNEPILIDLGVDYLGYKSDLTRVFFLGKIHPLVKKIYAIVKEAGYQALRKIKPGCVINKIDLAARQYITQRGYGGFFGHNLGHGLGLEVHESPHICGQQNNKLKIGMVFTIEPAIYLPEKFGIRIEDMVLVTQKGAELISGSLDK